jgi:signal transduction histidine kinase
MGSNESDRGTHAGALPDGAVDLEVMEGLLAEWRAMVDAIDTPIVVVDADGIVLRCNRALAQWIGQPFQAIIGRPRRVVLGDGLGFPEDCWLPQEGIAPGPVTVVVGASCFDVRTYPFVGGRGTTQGWVHVLTDVTERMQAQEMLARNQEHLRALVAQLGHAEAHAREQVATDLHDGLGTTLALAKLKLDTLCADAQGAGGLPAAEAARAGIGEAIRFTRELTADLFPPFLDELGLVPAAQVLADRLSHQHSVRMHVIAADDAPYVTGEAARAAFQSLRELLINVIKHAEATRATVRVAGAGDRLELSVTDDGRGFPAASSPDDHPAAGKFGLFSLRERLAAQGGTLHIDSHPGQGACVTLTFPLKETPGEGGAP